jgi:hypothetical protein
MNRLVSAVHEAIHDVPGVPEHEDRAPGHQGSTRHGQSAQSSAAVRFDHTRPHEHTPPRVLVRWQTRIAGLVGRSH